MTTEKKARRPTGKAGAADQPARSPANPLSLSEAEFRLLQRYVRGQEAPPEVQAFAAAFGAFLVENVAATKAAETLSTMLHSEDHGLSSIQQRLDEHPLDALTMVRLISLERARGAGQIERAVRQKLSSSGGNSRAKKYKESKEKLREIWATGKYSTRDRCAEEEYEAVGLRFSTARKALQGEPDPER